MNSSHNNNNIIISKPDKEAAVVILDKEYYNDKIADIVKDSTKFKTLGSVDEFNKTAIDEQQIQRELLEFYNDHQLPKKDLREYTPGWITNITVVWTPQNTQ